MFGSSNQKVVVCEADIEAALDHLRSLPYGAALPVSWDRQRLLQQLRDVIGPRPKIDNFKQVGPGVWALVKPFGVDLKDWDDESNDHLQVWLLIRPYGTDPTRITRL